MTNNSDNRHLTGAPASQGGQFKSQNRDESCTALTRPDIQLGTAGEWKNGGQGEGVSLVASPVSDRDRNYYVTLASNSDTGAYLTVSPYEFGIEDPDRGINSDLDRLFIGTNDARGAGALDTQYIAAYDAYGCASALDTLSEDELEAFEAEILAAVRAETGDDSINMEFTTSSDTWDIVSVMFNRTFAPGEFATVNSDGDVEFTTSNLMARLEDSAPFQKVIHDRIGDEVISRMFGARFPDHDFDSANEY